MAGLHAPLDLVIAITGLGVPRGLAWLTAMYGSERYSERAMRLLRRPHCDTGHGTAQTQPASAVDAPGQLHG